MTNFLPKLLQSMIIYDKFFLLTIIRILILPYMKGFFSEIYQNFLKRTFRN